MMYVQPINGWNNPGMVNYIYRQDRTDFIKRYKLVNLMIESDQKLIEELNTLNQQIESEKKELDSIVIKIVRAVEDKKPNKVYRAPLLQAKFAKIYSIFKA